MTLLAKVRERLPHYLSHDIGAAAGLSLWDRSGGFVQANRRTIGRPGAAHSRQGVN